MAVKRTSKPVVNVVVSNLSLAQAQALVAQALGGGERVAVADVVHDVCFSGSGYHLFRASTDVRLTDKVVSAGAIMRKAASAFGEPLEGESPTAHFVRVGLGAWSRKGAGMVRCLGSWTPEASAVAEF
jgi:hypothetical protein